MGKAGRGSADYVHSASGSYDASIRLPGERDQLLPTDRIDQRFRLSEAQVQ
jgi:hypothetical protein